MKKPFNRFLNFAYHVLGPLVRIWHPTTVEGLENIPQDGGVLFCSNHSSNWDPVLVILAMPVNSRVHVMGKEELFRNPALRWLLHKAGAFPVSRGNADIKAVKRLTVDKNVTIDTVLLEELETAFGSSNVKVVEKTIEMS